MGDECCEINQRPSIKSRFCDNLEFINDDLNCTGLGHFEWVPHNVTREHEHTTPSPPKKNRNKHTTHGIGPEWSGFCWYVICYARPQRRSEGTGWESQIAGRNHSCSQHLSTIAEVKGVSSAKKLINLVTLSVGAIRVWQWHQDLLLLGQHVLFFVTCPGCASSCWGQSESES